MRSYLVWAAMLACTAASAQTVTLQGMLGNRALLIVNGTEPKSVAPGDSYQGVKVVSTAGEEAVIEVDGKRHTLRVGAAPASVGAQGTAPGRGTRIVLTVDRGGHFFSQGQINGQAVQFMVDTGATSVSMGVPDAERIGIKYKEGQMAQGSTANGIITIWKVKLRSVKLGDVELFDIDASVVPVGMPYVLLGNSFLGRFKMTRHSDQMVLERSY